MKKTIALLFLLCTIQACKTTYNIIIKDYNKGFSFLDLQRNSILLMGVYLKTDHLLNRPQINDILKSKIRQNLKDISKVSLPSIPKIRKGELDILIKNIIDPKQKSEITTANIAKAQAILQESKVRYLVWVQNLRWKKKSNVVTTKTYYDKESDTVTSVCPYNRVCQDCMIVKARTYERDIYYEFTIFDVTKKKIVFRVAREDDEWLEKKFYAKKLHQKCDAMKRNLVNSIIFGPVENEFTYKINFTANERKKISLHGLFEKNLQQIIRQNNEIFKKGITIQRSNNKEVK